MAKLSQKSEDLLKGCHPDIQAVVRKVAELSPIEIMVLEGLRTRERQEELVRTGKSKTMNSKHLPQVDGTSFAVDIAPVIDGVIPWNDREAWIHFAGFVIGVAKTLGIVNLISGIDWDGDFNLKEHSFFDGPHFQLGK